jgi:hypothetical protein
VAERRAQHDGQARQIHGGGGGGQGGVGVGARMQRSLVPGLWAGLLCSAAAAASRRLFFWEERRVRAPREDWRQKRKRGKRPRSNRGWWQFSARVCLFNQEAFANKKKLAV